MAMIKYNIRELFMEYFGTATTIYKVPSKTESQPTNLNYAGVETLPKNYPSNSMSWMGTPIVFQAAFNGGTYSRYKLNGELERVRMDALLLPPATMFQFRRAKNIVRTNLLGANGTVKEIYGFDDWIIDVKGICLDEPGRTAHEQYEQLLEWERMADAIGVSGQLFTQKDIHAVAINEWQDNVTQGKPGTIPFAFQLYSDEPVELAIKLKL